MVFKGYTLGTNLLFHVMFAGLMVAFYEAFKDLADYGMQKWNYKSGHHTCNFLEGLVLGGLAGGYQCLFDHSLDVIKTRLQVQGSTARCSGWSDAIRRTWRMEG